MKLVIFLGNPGRRFDNTPHNAGFVAYDVFSRLLVNKGFIQEQVDHEVASGLYMYSSFRDSNNDKVVLVKPLTFMNLSGKAIVQAKRDFYVKENNNILVVADELDLPTGQYRYGQDKYSKSHNGMISIVEHIGKGFFTLRLGIESRTDRTIPGEDFVLMQMNSDEATKLNAAIKAGTDEAFNSFII
jgi:PTH1 family peptidyl-tRNA hydrolase